MPQTGDVLDLLTQLFVLLVGIGVLVVVALYVIDRSQTRHTIRRNYPVICRFRYLFEHLGEFFRQYFYALDREEMPFNRAERSWVYRAAKALDNTVSFGSSRDLRAAGAMFFANCGYPTMREDAVASRPLLTGPYCRRPYHADRVFHISGMSYGAISRPAVQALSRGAHGAGCWPNTGEGGPSPHHLEGGADIVFQLGTANYGVRDEHGRLSDERLTAVAGADFVTSARGFMFALGCIQATHDARLQRGRVLADKAERVRHCARAMEHEIGVIAHACGATEPRGLRRRRCRVVQASGRSLPLSDIWPEVKPRQRYRQALR